MLVLPMNFFDFVFSFQQASAAREHFLKSMAEITASCFEAAASPLRCPLTPQSRRLSTPQERAVANGFASGYRIKNEWMACSGRLIRIVPLLSQHAISNNAPSSCGFGSVPSQYCGLSSTYGAGAGIGRSPLGTALNTAQINWTS